MALIVGDDFQHILRVLNTNVDGREKVRRRFRFFHVREWVFGVRMRSSSSHRTGEAKPFWDRASLLGRIASRDEWERWNATRARDGSWRGGNICARECVSFEPFGCSRRARSGAKSDVILSFFSQNTKGSKKKGESFYDPTRVSCSSSKTFCVLTTRQTRFLFSSRNRSCTLSRKSKASVVDLPTSSAKRRKSIWVKELGNSPLLNSNR